MSWQTCIHRMDGLCPDCLEAFNADPGAWIEFGYHPEGIARWEQLQAEMDTYFDDEPLGEMSAEEWEKIPF